MELTKAILILTGYFTTNTSLQIHGTFKAVSCHAAASAAAEPPRLDGGDCSGTMFSAAPTLIRMSALGRWFRWAMRPATSCSDEGRLSGGVPDAA